MHFLYISFIRKFATINSDSAKIIALINSSHTWMHELIVVTREYACVHLFLLLLSLSHLGM